MSIIKPNCVDSCQDKAPAFSFNDCNPDTNQGQIDRIYIAAKGASSFVDWTLLAEWALRLDNSNVIDIDKIRFMNVIGEKPVAGSTPIEISRKRKIVSSKDHTINFDVDETDQVNYDALRQIECSGNYKIWYQAGKYLFGGNNGIDVFIEENDLIPKERKQLNTFNGKITWESKFHPERCLNPLP